MIRGPGVTMGFTRSVLPAFRDALLKFALTAGLPEQRAKRLVLAAHEAAANVILHGAGQGTMRAWVQSTELVCEVTDPAGWEGAEAAGLRPPEPNGKGGAGLWLIRQACDRVETRNDDDGYTIRMYVACG
jgi:anti-sigma regulatory factor (Ser/Thr protein kinase)